MLVFKRLTALAVMNGALLAGAGAALAEPGRPTNWQLGLQESATPVMDIIISFHNYLLIVVTLITLFVLGLLVVIAVRFNAKANPTPSRTTHHTLLEVAWTVVPVIILVAIAIPSFRLLFYQLNLPAVDLTIRRRASSGIGPTATRTTASSNSTRSWSRIRPSCGPTSRGCLASTTRWWCP